MHSALTKVQNRRFKPLSLIFSDAFHGVHFTTLEVLDVDLAHDKML